MNKEKNQTPGTSNPIIRDRFTADPAALIVNDKVYIVAGEDLLPPDAAHDEYFRIPRWVLYSSKDMKNFNFECVLLKSDDFSFGTPNSAWASQIIQGRDGKFYFYVTVRASVGQVVAVAVADEVTGPYIPKSDYIVSKQMVKEDTGRDQDIQIDPSPFIDDDGRVWLVWGQYPMIAELISDKSDPDFMIKIKRPIRKMFPDSWKSQIKYTEGPFLYKKGKYYYYIYASGVGDYGNEGQCTEAEVLSYSMSENIEGPWTDGVKLTDSAPAIDGGYSYTIQPAVIEFKGQSYLLYHNAMLELKFNGTTWRGSTGRRSLAVDYLYYNDDGTIRTAVTNEGISKPPEN